MAEKLSVSVVTPDGAVTRKDVDSVSAPSKLGEVTILPDHVPVLATMNPGVVTMRVGDAVDLYAVSGGFLEVERQYVRLLADTAERPEDIDAKRCEAEIRDAEAEMKKLDGHDPAYARAQAQIERNQVRLQIAKS